MSGLSELQAAVAANTTSVNSAVAAFQTIAAAGDPDGQVGALAATVAANNATLDAAVTAATPPAPAPAA